MIWIGIGVTLLFGGVSFVYGFYTGSHMTAQEYELRNKMKMETQMKFRIKDCEMDAIAGLRATSHLVHRMDSTGAKTIITLNHN